MFQAIRSLPAPQFTHPDGLRDGYKFTFFSLAALQLTRAIDWTPDIIHANDWHTAPALYALKIQRDPQLARTSALLGLHNLPYMGVGAGPAMLGFDLPPASGSSLPWWAQDMPLPLGMLAADHIVAASPSYASEILTPEFGIGTGRLFAKPAGENLRHLERAGHGSLEPRDGCSHPQAFQFRQPGRQAGEQGGIY